MFVVGGASPFLRSGPRGPDGLWIILERRSPPPNWPRIRRLGTCRCRGRPQRTLRRETHPRRQCHMPVASSTETHSQTKSPRCLLPYQPTVAHKQFPYACRLAAVAGHRATGIMRASHPSKSVLPEPAAGISQPGAQRSRQRLREFRTARGVADAPLPERRAGLPREPAFATRHVRRLCRAPLQTRSRQ
jgi:hypothetical protein